MYMCTCLKSLKMIVSSYRFHYYSSTCNILQSGKSKIKKNKQKNISRGNYFEVFNNIWFQLWFQLAAMVNECQSKADAIARITQQLAENREALETVKAAYGSHLNITYYMNMSTFFPWEVPLSWIILKDELHLSFPINIICELLINYIVLHKHLILVIMVSRMLYNLAKVLRTYDQKCFNLHSMRQK